MGLESIFIIRLPNGPGIPAVLALRVLEIRKRKQEYLQDHILHTYGVDGVVITTLVKYPGQSGIVSPRGGGLAYPTCHLSSPFPLQYITVDSVRTDGRPATPTIYLD